jgi:hypothetical protein
VAKSRTVKLGVVGRKFRTRCSSLPLLFSCPNAVRNPDGLTPVRVENGAEHLGTDIHAAIQHTIETGEIDLRKIERRYGAEDVERAKMLFANGLKVAEEAKRDMKNPQFEQEVSFETENFSVSGRVDLLDLGPSRAHVVDFKTGRTRDDHYHQMLGYAVGAWSRMGRPADYCVRIAYVYLETNEVTSYDVTAGDMAGWIRELDSLPAQYTVNRRCVYCPLNNTCPCFRDYLKGSLTLLLEVSRLPEIRIRRLDDAARAKLATAMKMGKTAIERIREHIKEEALRNGPIPLGNGDVFTIRTREFRVLLTAKALPVIARYVTAKDIANATKLSLNDLLTAAARRQKGPMRKVIREECLKALEKAGAVVTNETPFLETICDKGTRCQTKKPLNTKPRTGE